MSDAAVSSKPPSPDIIEERLVEVVAVVGGERAAENERTLHDALRRTAAGLVPVPLEGSALFQSFWIAGFECSTHRTRDGRRLDLIAATAHERYVEADYRAVAQYGMRTVRDGVRWHLIETTPGQYDWSSWLPMLRAAHRAGTQVIWDIAHWGWPDDLDVWSPAFVERFAAFAKAAARVADGESDAVPYWTPVNEISFWAWAGGSLGYINPFASGRGNGLKAILVQAAIAGIEAVRDVNPNARIAHAEPAIHVVPRSSDPGSVDAARAYMDAQFETLDFMSGRARPELGGRSEYVDLVGVNYYLHNQWVDGDLPIAVDDPRHRPFRDLLGDVHRRYGRPMYVAETGIEGDLRAPWLRIIAGEVAGARRAGVPVQGLCLYPITDYPGWDDERHCPTGLLGYADAEGRRQVCAALAEELELYRGSRSADT
jgi:beta-glucosidase/6-phospho-beta-glucosidase/beta-galactosidase